MRVRRVAVAAVVAGLVLSGWTAAPAAAAAGASVLTGTAQFTDDDDAILIELDLTARGVAQYRPVPSGGQFTGEAPADGVVRMPVDGGPGGGHLEIRPDFFPVQRFTLSGCAIFAALEADDGQRISCTAMDPSLATAGTILLDLRADDDEVAVRGLAVTRLYSL